MKENANRVLKKFNLRNRQCTKIIISIVMITILLCSNFFNVSIAKAADDPLANYQQIEKDNLNKKVASFTKYFAEYISKYQNALQQQVGLASTVRVTLDSSITDGTSMEGLKNIQATMTSMTKGYDSKTNAVISCNDKDLTSLEFYTTKELFYVLIPDLSKAFLKLDMNSLGSNSNNITNQDNIKKFLSDPASADLLNKILKKYGTIVINNINNVSMEKDVSISANEFETKYNKFTVSINKENSLNISKAILNEAKNDTELSNLFTSLGICTAKEYNDEIKELLSSTSKDLMKIKKGKSKKNLLKMELYCDGNGAIAGRNFSFNDNGEKSSFGYKTVKSGLSMGIEAWIKSDEKNILTAKGKITGSLTGFSGNIKISWVNYSTGNMEPIDFNINFKDLKYTKTNTGYFLNGNLAITSTSSDLKDISCNINFNGTEDKQDIVVDILNNTKSVALISISVKKIPFTDFNLLSSNDKIYDITTQMEEYLKQADLTGYLKRIKEKSNISFINNMIDKILNSSSIYNK